MENRKSEIVETEHQPSLEPDIVLRIQVSARIKFEVVWFYRGFANVEAAGWQQGLARQYWDSAAYQVPSRYSLSSFEDKLKRGRPVARIHLTIIRGIVHFHCTAELSAV